MGNDASTLNNNNGADGGARNGDGSGHDIQNIASEDSSIASHHSAANASSMLTGRLRHYPSSNYARSVSSNVSVHDMSVAPFGTAERKSNEGDADENDEDGDPGCCQSTFDKLNAFRNLCGAIVNDSRFQLFVVLLITINAILMGVATFEFVRDKPEVRKIFDAVDLGFLIFFTVELVFQFIYNGLYLFNDGWLVFDFLIILMSWSLSGVQVIRAFRIFRALRLITRIKVMKNLVVALFSVMPRMVAIFGLTALLFYIFAVMFTQLFKDLYVEGITDYDYFSRMDHTFFTLFQMMTLDGWGELTRMITAEPDYAWAVIPMTVFVILSGFVIANLFIAVICEAISALHEDEKEKIHGYKSKKNKKKNPAVGDATFGDGRGIFRPALPTSLDDGSVKSRRLSNASILAMPNPSFETDYVNMNSLDQTQPSPVPSNVSDYDDRGEDEASAAIDLRGQIEFVEGRIEELTRMQTSTVLMLQRVSKSLEARRNRDDTDATSWSTS